MRSPGADGKDPLYEDADPVLSPLSGPPFPRGGGPCATCSGQDFVLPFFFCMAHIILATPGRFPTRFFTVEVSGPLVLPLTPKTWLFFLASPRWPS